MYIMRLTKTSWYTGKEQTIFSKNTVLYEVSIPSIIFIKTCSNFK